MMMACYLVCASCTARFTVWVSLTVTMVETVKCMISVSSGGTLRMMICAVANVDV